MSRLNPRNYQLGLAFNDTDLREPKHDEIMHWLSAWAKQEVNIRALLRPAYRDRWRAMRHVLDEAATRQVAEQSEHKRRWIDDAFRREHAYKSAKITQPWPDEPIPQLDFQISEWEVPLSSERGPVMGFCDFCCRYKVGDTLCRLMTRTHALESALSEYGVDRWTFPKVSEISSWEQSLADLRLFFEVKTKIPSVGELMRQLQLYRTSPTFRVQGSFNDAPIINKMIVVAPPNNEAASVCQEHGILFIEYRPD